MKRKILLPLLAVAGGLTLAGAALAQDEDSSDNEGSAYPEPPDTWQRLSWGWNETEQQPPTPEPRQVSGPTVSLSTLKAPKQARKAYEQALAAIRKNRLDNAEKSLEEAVRVYPEFGVAWLALGAVQATANHPEQAEAALRKAVKLEPKDPLGYGLLCEIARQRADWPELEHVSALAIASTGVPDPSMHLNNAVANYAMGQFSKALTEAKAAVRLDPGVSLPRARLVLGLSLYFHNDLEGAVRNLRAYLTAVPNAEDGAIVRRQLAQMERLQGAAAR